MCADWRINIDLYDRARIFDDTRWRTHVCRIPRDLADFFAFSFARRDLNQLEWLLINSNELASLDGELPSSGHNLKMLYAVDNKLTHLPAEFRYLHRLETLFLQHNKIRNLDGTLQKARRLKFLELSYNELQEVIRLRRITVAQNSFQLFTRFYFSSTICITCILPSVEIKFKLDFERQICETERQLQAVIGGIVVRRAHSESTCSRILRFNAHDVEAFARTKARHIEPITAT